VDLVNAAVLLRGARDVFPQNERRDLNEIRCEE